MPDNKSPLFKISIVGNGSSKIACTHYNHTVSLINSKNLCNFFMKILYIISISLLPKSAKLIQILTYLRCSNIHFNTQLA